MAEYDLVIRNTTIATSALVAEGYTSFKVYMTA